MKGVIKSKEAPAPIGPYSQAVDAGSVYCSGQIGVDPVSGKLEDGIVKQTRRALSNLDGVLRSAGLGMANVVKTTVFLVDLSEYQLMNEEYAKHFSEPFPARTTVQAAGLPRNSRVEIDAVAVR